MKKINIARIVWIIALFLLLIVILLMVIDYKIHYQYLVHNQLYFYECNGELCVSESEDNSKLRFSIYDCGYEECPVYSNNIEDQYAILKEPTTAILYDYRNASVISSEYEEYQFINSNYIIVTLNGKQGVIDINNNLTVDLEYEKIGYQTDDFLSGYNFSAIIAKKDNQYGIISYKNGNVIEEFKYKEEDINTLLEVLKKDDV